MHRSLDEAPAGRRQRFLRLVLNLLDPRTWLGFLRLVNNYSYDHVQQRRRLVLGRDARISPTASFRHADHVHIGDRTRVGDHVALWAGEASCIRIGSDCSFGPYVYVTSSDYNLDAGTPVMYQGTCEGDVVIGDGCWLGAQVIVTRGVTIGAGTIVGAGSVVTHDLPPGSVAVGVPARVVRLRSGS